SVARPVVGRRETRVADEELAKCDHVAVTDALRDFADGLMAVLEQSLRCFDAYALDVLARRVARGAMEATDERARAHGDAARERVDRRHAGNVGLDQLLGPKNALVAMRLLRREHRICALRRLVGIDEEHARRRPGHLWAQQSLDEEQREVDE